MKKIKRLSHLQSERRRLRERRRKMEICLREDWSRIRYTFRPATLLREAVLSYAAKIGRRLLSK